MLGNILTFAEEYRQKSFTQTPFCIVDSLILSQIVYFDYSGSSFKRPFFGKRLCDFYEEGSDILMKGMMTKAGDEQMLKVLKQGGRHGDLRACSYVEEFCEECGKQFAAITFELGNGEYYIAFRGTDCSVVGWKEDFALSFQEQIPAQKSALVYAEKIMRRLPGRFLIGGHSKGGNLALYAAMHLPGELQERVKAVYNFDGPGFLKQVYENSGYRNIRPLVHKIVPQSSIIGMILEEDDLCQVVHSTADAVRQHDPYSWVVNGCAFEQVDSVDTLSGIVKRVLDEWLEELPYEERRKIIDTVFDVIYSIEISEFYEITEQKYDKIRALLNNAGNIEPEERKRVFAAVKRLLAITAEELHRAAREESAVQLERRTVQMEKGTAQLKELMQLERRTAQLEKRALQLEKFIQSIQHGDWNKPK